MLRALLVGALALASAQSTKQAKPKGGLPGLTPAKKANAEIKAAPTTTPTPYAAYRAKLQSSFCPTAQGTDKETVACKSWSITEQMKKASADEKKKLTEQRLAMYREVGKKTEEEKKAAGLAAKALYTRMFAGYCTGDKSTDPLCVNALMRKMYGAVKA